ncbi:MAG: hypothetical protein WBQ86_03095 [Candidatus Binatus sp.]
MAKPDVLAELTGVREYVEGSPVELVRDQEHGRLVIRAYNEGGLNFTEIDLFDLLACLKKGPKRKPRESDPRRDSRSV